MRDTAKRFPPILFLISDCQSILYSTTNDPVQCTSKTFSMIFACTLILNLDDSGSRPYGFRALLVSSEDRCQSWPKFFDIFAATRPVNKTPSSNAYMTMAAHFKLICTDDILWSRQLLDSDHSWFYITAFSGLRFDHNLISAHAYGLNLNSFPFSLRRRDRAAACHFRHILIYCSAFINFYIYLWL